MNKRFMRFPGGKTKTITLSYDDAMEEDKKLIALMEKYGMKGTFNLIPGWFAKEGTVYPKEETYRLVSETLAKEIYNHPLVEVANHGNCHKYMPTLSQAEMADDMISCRKKLEAVFEKNISGMAYPYGWYSKECKDVLAMCGIVYSRTVSSTHDFGFPEDWLEWHPTCHHDDEKLMLLAEEFIGREVKESSQMFYVWGHTFEFERNHNWQVIEDFMKKVSGKEDTWYATNIEIYQYVKAYENLEISLDGRRIINFSRIPVWVEIDGTVYEVKEEIIL
ncbi:MAG: polysaccharide deacetylase family protein [Lachnospiraceae bacterium]|nr:polysaccharide deacetylase family protein [Lachnospiraceae bacterium]